MAPVAAIGLISSVSLLALLLLVHLLGCATTSILLSFAAIRGRKYDWYLYTMSFVSLSSVAAILTLPLAVLFGEAVPCAVGFPLRYVLPAFSSGLYLLGHLSVLIVFCKSADAPPRRGVEAIATTRQPSMRRASVCFLLFMTPLAATPSSIFALRIATCQDDDAFRSLYWIQVGQSCVWAIGCKYISLLYDRAHGKAVERFRTIHYKTSKGLCMSALLVAGVVLVALALHWDGYYTLYLDYTFLVVLHFNLAFWYFDGYRKSRRIAGVGPHVHAISARTMSARTMSFRSNKSTAEDTDTLPWRFEMDDVKRFLVLDDYFSDFLAFCDTLGRTHEPLSWRLVQLHKQRKVLPAVVYNDCMSPNGPLVTMTGLSMAPKVASVVRARPDTIVGETLDQLYAAFETDLLRVMCQQILPKYQKSGRLWYSFAQRPADIAAPEPPLTSAPFATTLRHAPSTLLPTTNEHGSNTTDAAVPGSHDAAGSSAS